MYSKLVSEMLVNINDLLNSYRNLFTKEEYMAIKKIYFELKKSSISSIEELKNFEDRLIGYFGRAWNYYLSDFSTFKNGDDFRFVITCPTVYASDYDLKDRAFLSTSLVTNKHMGTFNRINYGIVCSVDESNLLVVSSKDVNVVGKKLDGYYLASTHGEENLYSREYVNNLQLPLEIENEMIKDNIVFNGDFIIDPNKNIYSDVSLNPKTTKFLGVILFKPYSEKDYKEASSLASKYNLILKIVDKDFYYDKISSIKYSKDKRGKNGQRKRTNEYYIF